MSLDARDNIDTTSLLSWFSHYTLCMGVAMFCKEGFRLRNARDECHGNERRISLLQYVSQQYNFQKKSIRTTTLWRRPIIMQYATDRGAN